MGGAIVRVEVLVVEGDEGGEEEEGGQGGGGEDEGADGWRDEGGQQANQADVDAHKHLVDLHPSHLTSPALTTPTR